jgi:hypothetical protein
VLLKGCSNNARNIVPDRDLPYLPSRATTRKAELSHLTRSVQVPGNHGYDRNGENCFVEILISL